MCECKTKCSCKCETLVTPAEFDAAWAVVLKAKSQGILQNTIDNGEWHSVSSDSIWSKYRIKPQPVGPESLELVIYSDGSSNVLDRRPNRAAAVYDDEKKCVVANSKVTRVKYIRAPENEQPS